MPKSERLIEPRGKIDRVGLVRRAHARLVQGGFEGDRLRDAEQRKVSGRFAGLVVLLRQKRDAKKWMPVFRNSPTFSSALKQKAILRNRILLYVLPTKVLSGNSSTLNPSVPLRSAWREGNGRPAYGRRPLRGLAFGSGSRPPPPDRTDGLTERPGPTAPRNGRCPRVSADSRPPEERGRQLLGPACRRIRRLGARGDAPRSAGPGRSV